jgi:segregation and condensation protein B
MITAKIEAVLFAAAKPVEVKALAKLLDVSQEVLREAIDDVKARFNADASGIHVLEHEGKLQLVTNPAFTDVVKGFVKEDVGGELTRPSLEALTIIAYRGPVTKPEIEQIRGVNCSLILRNLLMRGLIEEREDIDRLQSVYSVSSDFLRHLGLHDRSELPGYNEFHDNERINKMLAELHEAAPIHEV